MMTLRCLILGPLAAAMLLPASAATDPFADLPPDAAPAEVGKRIAENVIARKFRYEVNPEKAKSGIIYPEVIGLYGSLTFARASHNDDLAKRIAEKFEPHLTEPGSTHINRSAHVDFRVLGALPLEIYQFNHDERLKTLGLELADAQWQKTTDDGITTEARYWIDDMFMIPVLQMQAYRVTNDAKYADRAALTMSAYFDKLQQPNGLFFHGTDAQFYWGRGNGWMAAGSSEVLRSLPKDHPKRERILAGYRKMMEALLKTQADDGLWRQLLDKPESWTETSGSAMFAFAMVSGVKNGWLDAETYGPAARKAWIALAGKVDAKGNLADVCIGTNKGFDEKFYLERPKTSGDLHGEAPMLWTATALLREAK